MSVDNRRSLAELSRILWRQTVMSTTEGVDWLTKEVAKGAKERDLGPHRARPE